MNLFGRILNVCALFFIGITAGAALIYFEVFPYKYFSDAFVALEAVLQSEKRSDDIATQFTGAKPPSPFDRSTGPIRDDVIGVTRYQKDVALDGFTLYASGYGEPAVNLVDMQGSVVHKWNLDKDMLMQPRPDGENIPLRGLQATPFMFANGDLLLALTVRGTTPWGLGLVKLDKDSNLIWAFLERVHHDADIDADGTIYTLGHFIEKEPRAGLEIIKTPFVDDTVIILSSDGVKLREFSVLDAIRDSDFQGILRYADPASYNGDILHTNSIQVLNKIAAAGLPAAEPGYLLLSLRNMGVILLVDPQQEKVVWATRGFWHMQHDPDFLDNGNILLFDNLGDTDNGGQSRVLEIDPNTMQIIWSFPGATNEVLFSAVKSSQQRLGNGNTLITETNNGRLLEVTSEGEVAWEFYIPEQVERNDFTVKKVVEGTRFTPDEIEFEFNYGE
jgi:outer membrane protein assembly factor BamB